MAAPDILMYEEEFNEIKRVISKLRIDANAKVVFLVDKNGQQIAAQGEIENLDTTSLASLTAGNVAATDGLARLIGEKEFSILFHEGERDNIHISIVGQRLILVVIFDERSSLGLVRIDDATSTSGAWPPLSLMTCSSVYSWPGALKSKYRLPLTS